MVQSWPHADAVAQLVEDSVLSRSLSSLPPSLPLSPPPSLSRALYLALSRMLTRRRGAPQLFLMLYKELYFRHLYAKLGSNITIEQRIESWDNYTSLFERIFSDDDDDNLLGVCVRVGWCCREKERVCVCERERVCVCVCERERERESVCVFMCVRECV